MRPPGTGCGSPGRAPSAGDHAGVPERCLRGRRGAAGRQGVLRMGGGYYLGEAKGRFPEDSPFPQRAAELSRALRACLGDRGTEWREMLVNSAFLPCCFISEFLFKNSLSFWQFQAHRNVAKRVQRMLVSPLSRSPGVTIFPNWLLPAPKYINMRVFM